MTLHSLQTGASALASARIGTSALNGATPPRCVVSNTTITAATKVFLSRATTIAAAGLGALVERTDLRVPGVSFTIEGALAGDTSSFNWLLIEP